jgi:putative FmdB family regulatory protein
VPTYQYACTECGHAFEQFQSFSDDALTQCPECQGRLRKLFNAVGVVFKGSGFYRTDSRSGSTATDGASGGTKTESKSETKTESKPAAAAASSTSSSSD